MIESCKTWLCKDGCFFFFRLAAGLPFLLHGWGKLTGMGMTVKFFGSLGLASPFAWLVALVEFLGGSALILGYGRRVVATLLAVDMFFAIVLMKNRAGLFGGHELETVLFLLSLGLALSGACDGMHADKACTDGACEMPKR